MIIKRTSSSASFGLAGALTLATGISSYASIVSVSVPSNVNIPAGTATSGPVSWDVNNDGLADFNFVMRHNNIAVGSGVIWQAQMNPATGTGATNGVIGYSGPFVRYSEAFAAGTVFGPTLPANSPAVSFSTQTVVILGSRYRSGGVPNYYGGFATGATTPGTNAFAGFRFDIGGQTNYGWIQLSVGAGTISFVNAAYETTPNTGIAAGEVVPEPGSLAMLAFGAVGVVGVRRRRKPVLKD